MVRLRFRAAVVLISLPLVVTGVVASRTGAAPAPPPVPAGGELPAGPWPPGKVLAADPDKVAAPLATTAAVVNSKCPAPPYGAQHFAPGAGKTVALTFDDGPGPTTPQILEILQRYGVPATFFNIGVNQTVRPAEVRSAAALQAPLGNHTWGHPRMPTLSAAAQAAEMDRTSAEQVSLVGSAPCLFRPPYGEFNATTLALAQQRRMAVWNWSVDTEDWKAGTSNAPEWVNRIITRAEAGGSQQHPVILMHNPPSGLPATVTALPTIIAFYQARGYTFVDLMGHPGQRPPPAAAVTATGKHVLVRGAAGALYQRIGRPSGWTGWQSLGGGIVSGPSAVATDAATTAVFITGTNNQVYQRTVTDTGGGGWTNLGGVATSKPGAAAGPGGRVAVVIRGTTGAAYLREYAPAGGWRGWTNLGGGLASAPTVAITADGGLTVAMIGTDNALWVRHRTGTVWAAWHRIGGYLSAEPAMSATADGSRLVGVFRGHGGATGTIYAPVADAAGAQWPSWPSLGGNLISGAAITVDGAAVDAFGYGTNGRIYQNVARTGATATGWTGWQVLPA
jgi:peptidoglycan/xylan/chitin deacetylase (PgdA/CDA1 family)